MPNDYSIRLPHVTEVAITKAKELLAFSTLPYYQASGNLLAGEGAVAIGDPIAWDTSAKKYIKYAPGATDVEDEAVGTGDSAQQDWALANDYVKEGTLVVEVDAVEQVEGKDYIVGYKAGYIHFHEASIPGVVDITASYTHFTAGGTDAAKAVGFVRIPGDSTGSADVAIEALIGGAVKYSVVSAATNWDSQVLVDLGAKYWEIADALIW